VENLSRTFSSVTVDRLVRLVSILHYMSNGTGSLIECLSGYR